MRRATSGCRGPGGRSSGAPLAAMQRRSAGQTLRPALLLAPRCMIHPSSPPALPPASQTQTLCASHVNTAGHGQRALLSHSVAGLCDPEQQPGRVLCAAASVPAWQGACGVSTSRRNNSSHTCPPGRNVTPACAAYASAPSAAPFCFPCPAALSSASSSLCCRCAASALLDHASAAWAVVHAPRPRCRHCHCCCCHCHRCCCCCCCSPHCLSVGWLLLRPPCR